MSVDPLTKSYPELTPYQFASNRPIDGVDLDGAEWQDSYGNWTDQYNGRYVQLSNGNWLYSRPSESGQHQYYINDGEKWIDQGTGGGYLLHTKSAYLAVNKKELFSIVRINQGLHNSILNSKYGDELATSFMVSEIHRAQGDAAKVTLFAGVVLATGGVALETAPLWMPAMSRMAKTAFSLEASGIGFAADAAAQTTFNVIEGNDPISNYNLVSGLSNTFLKNPFVGNYLGSQFSLNTSLDFKTNSTEGAIASGLVGGGLGTFASKFSKYTSSNFRIDVSSLRLNGTSSLANPIGIGASTFANYFSNINSQLSEKLINNDKEIKP